jgi:hypothetical protein
MHRMTTSENASPIWPVGPRKRTQMEFRRVCYLADPLPLDERSPEDRQTEVATTFLQPDEEPTDDFPATSIVEGTNGIVVSYPTFVELIPWHRVLWADTIGRDR